MERTNLVVGTAGHVDHGKSTLVRHLTGVEPDRWDEERKRGLSIGLGYAALELAGVSISMIDVPGHSRFLPTMMQGAHAVDIAMVVVDAHEGWMPQTERHVAVLGALGTPTGFVVLTHVDRVGGTELAAVDGDVRSRVEGTFLESEVAAGPVPLFDGTTGAGAHEVLGKLHEVARRVGPHTGWLVEEGRPRLWVDRSFVLEGAGRVCTGTLTGGSLAVGDAVALESHTSGGGTARESKVASLQVHGGRVEVAHPGMRVGVRLGSRSPTPVVGDALVVPSQWECGAHLHAALAPLRGKGAPLQRRGYELVMGTARRTVELRRSPVVSSRLDDTATVDRIGGRGGRGDRDGWEPVRLHCTDSIAAIAPGDRFVVVDSSDAQPVAAGIVLAADQRIVRRGIEDLAGRFSALVDRDPAALAGVLVEQGGGQVAKSVVLGALGGLPGGTDERFALRGDDLVERGAVSDVESAQGARAQLLAVLGARLWKRHELHDALVAAGLSGALVQQTLNDGSLVSLERTATRAGTGRDNRDRARPATAVVLVGVETLRDFGRSIEQRLGGGPASLAELRDQLGLSRGDTLAVLEHFDRVGITRREGSLRVLGSQEADLEHTRR
ncbi:MAG: SelB C-terminal domain-containing protein [Microthrixaceae bacterium]